MAWKFLSSAGAVVALGITKAALFLKIRMFERSEFGFLETYLAALVILSATGSEAAKTSKPSKFQARFSPYQQFLER